MTSRVLACVLLGGALFAAPAASQKAMRLVTTEGASQQPAEKGQEPAPIYDEKADAKAVIAAALAKAKRDDTRVLIQWGANWCGWCRKLHTLFKQDRAIAKELLYEYQLVMVDMGKFDKNVDLAKGYGAEIKGIPFLTVLDADGKVLVNQPTDPLEEGDHHSPAKVLEFLQKYQAPARKADDVLAAGLQRAKAEGKMVFLHFGAPWCPWCHRLEDWMATEPVAQRLAKDFVGVKIDEDRMEGGKDVDARYRHGEAGGIPWFAFLDGDGNVLVTSDGPNGNVGFPAQPEEIAHFVAMLKQVKNELTDADIAYLEQSLQPKPAQAEAPAHGG